MAAIQTSLFPFLKALKANNNREWFTAHKTDYQSEYAAFKDFADAIYQRMQSFDVLDELNIFRIYRDVRFSKDKSPYKSHFSFYMRRATRLRRGGYYLHIEPGASFVGGGFWAPEAQDLKRIRQELAADPAPLRAIISDPVFLETFGKLEGEQLKGAPQGFAKDHPAIDLLRYKQFLVMRNFTDAEVLAPQFAEQAVQTFRNMLPFFDYMSEVLTTDANGIPLWDAAK